jgi:hypothetical protein
MQVPHCSGYLLFFIDVGEDSVMADDVVMSSNPLVTLVKEEELEEAPLNMNVFQQLNDEDVFRIVVHTQVHHSALDCQSSPNPHALKIYLEFVPANGVTSKRFEDCQCEDDDVCLHCQTSVPGDSHYRSHHSSRFGPLTIVIYPP